MQVLNCSDFQRTAHKFMTLFIFFSENACIMQVYFNCSDFYAQHAGNMQVNVNCSDFCLVDACSMQVH
jgi:hypothetical protein